MYVYVCGFGLFGFCCSVFVQLFVVFSLFVWFGFLVLFPLGGRCHGHFRVYPNGRAANSDQSPLVLSVNRLDPRKKQIKFLKLENKSNWMFLSILPT